jgi:MFS family permease
MNLNWKQAVALGFGFAAIFLIWPIFNQFVPLFLQAGNPLVEDQLLLAGRPLPAAIPGFALAPAVAFFIMTWDNLLNIVVQPWVGVASDRSWTRFGRRKPWLLVGVPIAALGFIFIPLARTLLAIMAAILVVSAGMAIFRAPTAALLGDLFPPGQRSQVRGITGVMAGSSGALALIVGSVLFERVGPAVPFIAAALLMVVMAALAFLLIQEPPPPALESSPIREREVIPTYRAVFDLLRRLWQAEDRSRLFLLLTILLSFMTFESLQTGISSFTVFTLGLSPAEAARYATIWAVAVVFFAIPGGLVGSRIGRQRTVTIGLTGLFLMAAGSYFFIQSPATLVIALAVGGFFWALIAVNDLPFLYDLGDEGEIGAYTGVYFVATQAAAILGPVLAGFVIGRTASHRTLFVFAALCALAAWFALRRVRQLQVRGTANPTSFTV